MTLQNGTRAETENGVSILAHKSPSKEDSDSFVNNYQATVKPFLTNGNSEQNLQKIAYYTPDPVEKTSRWCCRRPEDISKRAILKNVIVLSGATLLTFTAYGSLSALQSSLHLQQGMGVINQAFVYAVMAVSCLALPNVVIRVIGHKWCIAVSLIGFVLWMGANGYGVWGSMLPASVVLGMCTSTLWTTLSSYFSILAKQYALKTKQQPAATTSLFFGIFVAFYATSTIIGSLLSSNILSQGFTGNATKVNELELGEVCGLNDCPGTNINQTNLSRPPSELVWILVGVDIALGTVAVVIVCVFVDSLPLSWTPDFGSPSKNICQVAKSSLMATVKQICRKEQLFLIPITLYSGKLYAFLDAEYTKSFISCFLAIWMVGWCLLPGAVCRVLGALINGRVAKYSGIIPIFVWGVTVDLVYQLTLQFWKPSTSQPAVFFIVPCLATLAESVWHPQLKALYAVLFAEDTAAAFAVYELLNALGCIMVFSYSSFLCTRIKLYIYTSFFGVGATLLFVLLVFVKPKSLKSKEVKG